MAGNTMHAAVWLSNTVKAKDYLASNYYNLSKTKAVIQL